MKKKVSGFYVLLFYINIPSLFLYVKKSDFFFSSFPSPISISILFLLFSFVIDHRYLFFISASRCNSFFESLNQFHLPNRFNCSALQLSSVFFQTSRTLCSAWCFCLISTLSIRPLAFSLNQQPSPTSPSPATPFLPRCHHPSDRLPTRFIRCCSRLACSPATPATPASVHRLPCKP